MPSARPRVAPFAAFAVSALACTIQLRDPELAPDGQLTPEPPLNYCAAAANVVPSSTGLGLVPLPRLVGRFDTSTDPTGARFAYPGSTITARFVGTRLVLRMKTTPATGDAHAKIYFQIRLDNRAAVTLITDDEHEDYLLADGIPSAPVGGSAHEVTIVRLDGADAGTSTFVGFDLGGTGTLLPPTVRSRKIEFIGDQLLMGLGIGASPGSAACTADDADSVYRATTDVTKAFPYVVARELDAEATIVTRPYVGIYRDNASETTGSVPTLWAETNPNDGAPWEFPTDATPDVVVVQLGDSGDFLGPSAATGTTAAMTGIPPSPPTVPNYDAAVETFVASIRARYPDAFIYLLVSPTVDVTFGRTYLVADATAIAASFTSPKTGEPDGKVFVVQPDETTSLTDPTACDGFPSADAHALWAPEVEQAIRDWTCW